MKGFVPTPPEIVNLMVEKLFCGTSVKADSTILDPGCGRGAFIDGIIRWCCTNNQDLPRITGIDSDPWVEERAYNNAYTPDALIQFCSSRASLLKLLEKLSNEDWEKSGQHSIFGPTTLKEILGFVAVPDRDHIGQAWKTLQIIQD